MIFVTVGNQLGFDRLIKHVDALAPRLDQTVFAQTCSGTYRARNIETVVSLETAEFLEMVGRAQIVIAHAGIGSILSAVRMQKPIILVPRQASLGEHRNDHQLSTANRLSHLNGVTVAWTLDTLEEQIASAVSPGPIVVSPERSKLVATISDAITKRLQNAH